MHLPRPRSNCRRQADADFHVKALNGPRGKRRLRRDAKKPRVSMLCPEPANFWPLLAPALLGHRPGPESARKASGSPIGAHRLRGTHAANELNDLIMSLTLATKDT